LAVGGSKLARLAAPTQAPRMSKEPVPKSCGANNYRRHRQGEREDKEGRPYTVRYDAVNAMLLNEFLKEHRTVQELKSEAAKQEATIAEQQKQIEALTAALQKVNAQLELSKPAPQTVLNNQ